MPSLIGTYIAANYQATVAPFSNFGTRNLAFIKIALSGGTPPSLTAGTDPVTGVVDPASNGSTSTYPGSTTPTQYFNGNAYNAPNSYLSVVVRTAQQYGEVYYVSAPSSTAVLLGVAYDTFADEAATGNVELITSSDPTNPQLAGSNVFVNLANQIYVALNSWSSGAVTITQVALTPGTTI